jgi:hypothetical protein
MGQLYVFHVMLQGLVIKTVKGFSKSVSVILSIHNSIHSCRKTYLLLDFILIFLYSIIHKFFVQDHRVFAYLFLKIFTRFF